MSNALLRVILAVAVGCMPMTLLDRALAGGGVAAWSCAATDRAQAVSFEATAPPRATSGCCGEGCTCDPGHCPCVVQAPPDAPAERPASTPPSSGLEGWRLFMAAPSIGTGVVDAAVSRASPGTGSTRADRGARSARAILLQGGVLRN